MGEGSYFDSSFFWLVEIDISWGGKKTREINFHIQKLIISRVLFPQQHFNIREEIWKGKNRYTKEM